MMQYATMIPIEEPTVPASTRRLPGARRLLAAAASAAVVVICLQPIAAEASSVPISGDHVTGISHTAFSVALSAEPGSGWTYHLYASTTKSKVYASNLSQALTASSKSASKILLSNLSYTTAAYWWRIQATNGSVHRTGPMHSVGLRPSTPTSVSVHTAAGRFPWLTWSSGAATGFTVQTATNSTFTSGLGSYSVRYNARSFTPYVVSKGTTYYYRVRAVNNGTASSFANSSNTAVDPATRLSVKAMTYNILQLTADGTSESGNTVAPWSQRRTGAAKWINDNSPDVVAIEEGTPFLTGTHTRQVDDLVSALGGGYGLASTEVTYPNAGWFRTGDYILYNKSTTAPVGSGGHFQISDFNNQPKFAAYQIMRNITTGAQFLFVSIHATVGSGSTYDQDREDEIKTAISDINGYNSSNGNLPVIFAGDYNSHPGTGHAFDGPGIAMAAAHNADSEAIAQSLVNNKYNSANQYLTTPPAFDQDIDHIYVPLGLGVSTFKIVIELSSGKLVMPIPSDHNALMTTVAIPY